MKEKRVSVGRIVHYWTHEGAELRENAAIVKAVGTAGRVFLHVFWATGFGGREELWAERAPFADDGSHVPTDGHWTWPATV